MKKTLLTLLVLLTAAVTSAWAQKPNAHCIVAGTPAEIFGTAWDAGNEANLMTLDEDYWNNEGGEKYYKTYTVDKAYTNVQLKVVKGSEWIGDANGDNVIFNLTGAGTFTVWLDADNSVVSVEGSIVQFPEFEYSTVYAVGNGEGNWLNGAAWDPAYAANEMTEVEEDVWEITFTNVPRGFERQIKFAIDGGWSYNFGGTFNASGVETDAAWDGGNIAFDTNDDCTVKVRLDLRNFDFKTKQGAKFTVTILYDSDKPNAHCIVAGYPAEIFGTAWDAGNEANLMTLDEGYWINVGGEKYYKSYTVDKAYTNVQLKVVKGSEWIGDANGDNVIFNLTGAGTFTVWLDADNSVVSVEGSIVQFPEFEYSTVYAVGNGEGNWLNGAAWDPAYAANEMTEVEEDVWEITFTNVPRGFERQIKFAIDGGWSYNFGGTFNASGVETDAVWDGDNIAFDTDDECTVKVRLDLRNFNFGTKQGAKFTVTITDGTEEEVTELELSETTDNTATIEDMDGKLANVTLTRTLAASVWNTFAAPFAIEDPAAVFGDDVEIRQLMASELDGNVLTLHFETVYTMDAGEPYLVMPTEDVVNPVFQNVDISKDAAPSETAFVDFIPTFGKTNVAAEEGSILALGYNNTLFRPTTLPADMLGFRAYFQLKGDAVGARLFSIDLDGEATGIKAIDKGQLTIDNSTIYDLQGRRIVNPTRGLYIVNGKKVVVK